MTILEHGGLPGWKIAVIAIAAGGGGVLVLWVGYKLRFKKSGTYKI